MGNRAVIAFSKLPSATGVYLHWNGGPESVLAFLEVCRARGYRRPDSDSHYAMARLVAVVCEFFDSGLSVGVGPLRELDVNNFDNGAYLVGGDWQVVERWGKGKGSAKSRSDLSKEDAEKMDRLVAHLMPKEVAL